jgi:hypothetical protein
MSLAVIAHIKTFRTDGCASPAAYTGVFVYVNHFAAYFCVLPYKITLIALHTKL